MSLADIPTALAALAEGKPVIVADDEGRENEGDVILAAGSTTRAPRGSRGRSGTRAASVARP